MVDKELIAKLREKYIQNPPEGMSVKEIREMDDEDLLERLFRKTGGLGHGAGQLVAHEHQQVERLGGGVGPDQRMEQRGLIAQLPHLAQDCHAPARAPH